MSLFACLTSLPAQTSASSGFEVATIKLSKGLPSDSSGIGTGKGKLSAKNVTLKRCISGAYGVGPQQILGGPKWIDSTRFDIEAQTDPSIDDDDTFMVMLQRLLADRFGLKLHRETKAMRAYSLEIAKNGPKLGPSGEGEAVTNRSSNDTVKTLDAAHVSMDLLAKVLARDTSLPVVNNTALTGLYSFKLRWTPDAARQADSKADDYGSLPDALREQLGLQLRVATIPVESLVLDAASMPTEN